MARKVFGIALFQVLVITAIFAMLAVYALQTSKAQIKIASHLQDRSQALVNLANIEAELYFELLTINQENENSGNISSKWNFHGEHFTHNNATIKLQDHSGLLNLKVINRTLFSRLLAYSGTESAKTQGILNKFSVADPTSGPAMGSQNEEPSSYTKIQDFSVFLSWPEVDSHLYKVITENGSLNKKGGLNFYHSPEYLVYALLSEDKANNVIRSRKERTNNIRTGFQTENNQSDFIYVKKYPKVLTAHLSAELNGIVSNREITFEISRNPTNLSIPLNIISIKGL